MSTLFNKKQKEIRAPLRSYLIVCGIWGGFAISYLFLFLINPNKGFGFPTIISSIIAISLGVWLRGFRIRIRENAIEYRNGFFISSVLNLDEIVKVQNSWVEWDFFVRKIKFLRIAFIATKKDKTILANPKPFNRVELSTICDFVKGVIL